MQYQYIDSAHNLLLDFWVQEGILGLGLIIVLIYFVLRQLSFFQRSPELMALLGLITALSFNPGNITTLLAFWWLISQGFTPRNK